MTTDAGGRGAADKSHKTTSITGEFAAFSLEMPDASFVPTPGTPQALSRWNWTTSMRPVRKPAAQY